MTFTNPSPSRRRALAMIAVGGAAATTPAHSATVDPWLTLKAERDQVEAEADRLFGIWGERMRGQPDDVGGGHALLYLNARREADTVLISAATLEAVTADDAKEWPSWGARLRAVLAAELAARQREIEATRRRLGLDTLDAETDRLSKRSEALDGALRRTEPTTLAGLEGKLRWLAANASDRGCLTVSAEQLDGLAGAAASLARARP